MLVWSVIGSEHIVQHICNEIRPIVEIYHNLFEPLTREPSSRSFHSFRVSAFASFCITPFPHSSCLIHEACQNFHANGYSYVFYAATYKTECWNAVFRLKDVKGQKMFNNDRYWVGRTVMNRKRIGRWRVCHLTLWFNYRVHRIAMTEVSIQSWEYRPTYQIGTILLLFVWSWARGCRMSGMNNFWRATALNRSS